ncbi:MAG: M20 family metallopeptidase, partial [Chloroflexota bacterium]
MMTVADSLHARAAEQIDDVAAFAARLVRTPSMPGEEGAVAALVRAEMERLAYDDVRVDDAGNVIGLLRGQGTGRSVLFNAHMDHVSPGDRAYWHTDPFSGHVEDGYLWGRAATDIKGSLACQVHLAPLLRAASLAPAGDVYVTAVVMEEIGGLGTQHLVTHLRTDSAVVGEPSVCLLKRGHRGRTGIDVVITGRAGHASAPDRAINPHTIAAAFLTAQHDLPLATNPEFGPATMVPTLYRSDNDSRNVIPESVRLHLDWRTVPGEDAREMVRTLQGLLDAALLPGSRGTVAVVEEDMTSYSGLHMVLPSIFRPYALPADFWAIQAAE